MVTGCPPKTKDKAIAELVETFVMLDADGILSTDTESTELDLEVLGYETDGPIVGNSPAGDFEENETQSEGAMDATISIDAQKPSPDSFYDDYCSRYMHFTDNNPTTFHTIDFFSELLEELRFSYLSEKETFNFGDKGGLYYSTRDQQALVAVVVGGKWKPLNGIGIVGSHVDALTAKLKPTSTKSSVHGYELLGVAPYSGTLNRLWLDRDLGVAGRVLVKSSTDNTVSARLVSSGLHAIARIPSLAPHFGSVSQHTYNKETQMVPVMAFGADEEPPTDAEKNAPLYNKHPLVLLRYIAGLANTTVPQLIGLDLDLYDVQPAARGGIKSDFIFAPRIDDRLCSFSAIYGLIESLAKLDIANYSGCSIVLLANNEEIGSGTRTGARGKFLNSVVDRLLVGLGHSQTDALVTYANSIILSADVTHALNPNFTSAYLDKHFPLPNTGLTLKKDANGHVMTDLIGVVLMEAIAAKNKLTLQQFHIRNDFPSGGTIGPILAVDTGARVIDVGLPQLSMHSIRAAAGYKEVGIGVETFRAFFNDWRQQLDLIDYL